MEEISIALRSILTRATAVHRDLVRAIGEAEMLRETGWLGVFESDKKFAGYQWDLDLQKRRGVVHQRRRRWQLQYAPHRAGYLRYR